MSTTDRQLLTSYWNDAWKEGLWAASWEKSLLGLSPAQAAWAPKGADGSTRHSIWQIVMHMIFWREDALRRLTDPTKPTPEQVAQLNFPPVPEATHEAWEELRSRFQSSQNQIAAVLREPTTDLGRLQYVLPHDCYHFGQINYLRAMLGLKPIE